MQTTIPPSWKGAVTRFRVALICVTQSGTIAFYGMNGVRLKLTNDEAYDLVIEIATGDLDEISAIAAMLERGTAVRAARVN